MGGMIDQPIFSEPLLCDCDIKVGVSATYPDGSRRAAFVFIGDNKITVDQAAAICRGRLASPVKFPHTDGWNNEGPNNG